MGKYFIHESNLERLEKRIKTIINKCRKYGTSFTYQPTGVVEYREVTDDNGDTQTSRFIEVEAEGSVNHGPWEFVAVLEHKSTGNVIRNFNTTLEVPERYRACGPTCEHCQKIRSRKDTYVIFNNDTQEFKQVGTGCLCEYTNGLDADEVAKYISMFDAIIKGESISGNGSFERYYDVEEMLRYAFECVKHFGYEKRDDYYYGSAVRTTRGRVGDYYAIDTGNTRWMSAKEISTYREEMQAVHFNADSQKETVLDALEWIKNEESNNSYINNLKVICAEKYCAGRDLGILISLPVAYNRVLKEAKDKAERQHAREQEKHSEYMGQVGDKIQFTTVKVDCVGNFPSIYGVCYLYKLVDVNGNVAMWSTDKSIELDRNYQVSCSIKKLEVYNSVKQTWVTRCRLTAA